MISNILKKISICTLVLKLTVSQVIAQTTVSGIVKDSTSGNPLENIIISLDGKIGTYTNSKGYFNLLNINPGNHQLVISSLGFLQKSFPLTIASEPIDLGIIQIIPNNIQIQEFEITATSEPQLFNNAYSAASTIVSKRELELSKPIGSEEALKKLAGVNVSGDMGISNRLNVGIRGSYPRRSEKVMLLEDGTPIAPAPYLAPEAYYNPPSDRLDGIEVIKGSDILAYGNNSMYGVINYITKRPPSKPTLGVNLTAGENGYQSQFITYGGSWNNLGAEVQVLKKHFDGFIQNSKSDIFNTTAKVYGELGEKTSFYLKINYHQENSKASYSALTPFTYKLDPRMNPFDADDLISKRYAADFVVKRRITKRITSTTKIYGSQFVRDWWRQENTLILAKSVRSKVGDAIYFEKYSYLEGQTFGDNDYVRIGNINSKNREYAKARNRLFKFAGIQETINFEWNLGELNGKLDISARYHAEIFNDTEIQNDSSRFGRSGKIVKDARYELNATTGYIRNVFSFGKLIISPILRYEQVAMRNFNLLQIATSTKNDGSDGFGSISNTYVAMSPGITVGYDVIKSSKNYLNMYASGYKGYNAPTSGYGFMRVEDNTVSAPTVDETPNIQPETSINIEGGLKTNIANNLILFQGAYFNNSFQNYYSAGRSEAFESLGEVRISGTEAAINLNLHQLLESKKFSITAGVSVTALSSQILSGRLKDSDLLSAKHTDATKQEIIDKINSERSGFDIYFKNVAGKDSLVSKESFATTDWSSIKRIDMNFGSSGITSNKVPYVPDYILNFSAGFGFKGVELSGNYNMVGAQFTDYLNMNNETSEGAMGKLPEFATIDANLSYTYKVTKPKWASTYTLFVAAKNLTNEIYMASRLHRVSSGIMPGGFRQINVGLKITL